MENDLNINIELFKTVQEIINIKKNSPEKNANDICKNDISGNINNINKKKEEKPRNVKLDYENKTITYTKGTGKKKKTKTKKMPKVSVICPTYNRRDFLPFLIRQFDYQTYPQELMELIIVDDSPEDNSDIVEKRDNIRYIYLKEKLILGEKRNYINKCANNEILVCFDDDDYYSPERVEHVVETIVTYETELVGSTILHIYFPELDSIYEYGPHGDRHTTNGLMAYTKKYAETHSYLNDKKVAEEGSFTNNFTERLIQLDPRKVMLCISHGENTVNKRNFIEKGKKTDYELETFFGDKNDEIMIKRIKNFSNIINLKLEDEEEFRKIIIMSDISLNI